VLDKSAFYLVISVNFYLLYLPTYRYCFMTSVSNSEAKLSHELRLLPREAHITKTSIATAEVLRLSVHPSIALTYIVTT